MSNNHKHPPDHSHPHTSIESTELKEYIEHNIRHLKDHINSFNKLQAKIVDKHAVKSLKNAINHLEKGAEELKHLLQHI
ncbi:MAG: hypothetical protein HWN66_00350 [Candidatus Helarchaeota archaeon]|nr:hypothetical protein [Candidatus Helarchaeota archaeon]